MIDLEAILKPISEENPAGENLRYSQVYDDIKEARRAEEALEQGDWQRELKTSDWDEVIQLSVKALTEKTKDLQIVVWLTEALCCTEGFEGCHVGLTAVNGLLTEFWDCLYPEIEEDDMDFRAAPLEFMNNNLPFAIANVSLTDPKATSGYSLVRWRETKDVGYEENTRDPGNRADLIKEGKLEPEVFDAAVARSSKDFYISLSGRIESCLEDFKRMDQMVDEKFGRDAPRLSEIDAALKDCNSVVTDILKKKREQEPDEVFEPIPDQETIQEEKTAPSAPFEPKPALAPGNISGVRTAQPAPTTWMDRLIDTTGAEEEAWEKSLDTLENTGLRKALEELMGAAYSAPSIREKNRYRLMMAKLCLQADRADLARPIAEELNSLLEELTLARWESPIWIAEVMDVLYRCLTAENASGDDEYKAQELFQKLCTTDVTRAIGYRGAS